MFGYVRPQKAELLVREYELYRALYCGVCRAMKRHTGRLSALALSYDSVFYALTRMMLTDAPCAAAHCRCIAHPCRGRTCVAENPALVYTARAFAVLAYGKVCDEVADRRGLSRLPLLLVAPVMRRAARRADLPDLLATMQRELADLAALEAENCPSLDQAADCTGRMLAAFFAHGLPGEAGEIAYGIGLHLGRFIAVADAAEDFDRDREKQNYNPLLAAGLAELDGATRRRLHLSLTGELCALERELLRLPHEKYPAAGNILKNIIYLGLPERIAFLRPDGDTEQGATL